MPNTALLAWLSLTVLLGPASVAFPPEQPAGLSPPLWHFEAGG